MPERSSIGPRIIQTDPLSKSELAGRMLELKAKVEKGQTSESDLQKQVNNLGKELEKLKGQQQLSISALQIAEKAKTDAENTVKIYEDTNKALSNTNRDYSLRVARLSRYEQAFRFAELYLDAIGREVGKWRPSGQVILDNYNRFLEAKKTVLPSE